MNPCRFFCRSKTITASRPRWSSRITGWRRCSFSCRLGHSKERVRVSLVPLALGLIRHEISLSPGRGRHANPDALKAAIEITKGAQVAVPRTTGVLELRKDPFAAISEEELDEYIRSSGVDPCDPKPVVNTGNAIEPGGIWTVGLTFSRKPRKDLLRAA